MFDVIVPYYNGSMYIVSLLSSILMQSNVDKINVTIVSDCSPDIETLRLAVDYFRALGLKVSIIHNKKNIGRGPAKQLGLEQTSEPYVLFADQDDTFANARVFSMIDELIQRYPDLDLARFSFEEIVSPCAVSLHSEPLCFTHGKVFSRKFLTEKNIKFRDVKWVNDDTYFVLLTYLNRPKIVSFTDVIYHWSHLDTNSYNNGKMLAAPSAFIGHGKYLQILCDEWFEREPEMMAEFVEDYFLDMAFQIPLLDSNIGKFQYYIYTIMKPLVLKCFTEDMIDTPRFIRKYEEHKDKFITKITFGEIHGFYKYLVQYDCNNAEAIWNNLKNDNELKPVWDFMERQNCGF